MVKYKDMNMFSLLLFRLLPLYAIILIGYLAGKCLGVKKESIAPLLIYTISPVIVFHAVVNTHISVGTLSLPILFYMIASGLCLLFFSLSRLFWHDTTRNILGFTAGAANVGYFGLPVVAALFPPELLGVAVLCIMGIILYENSMGFFIVARGHHSVSDSLWRVVRLPSLWAFLLGLVVNLSGIMLGEIYQDTVTSFRGAYVILGMMLIGLSISGMSGYAVDVSFIALSFFAKFFMWPVMMMLVLYVDSLTFSLYTPEMRQIMMILSIVPLAANTVAFATELKAQPEKAAFAVLISTVFALGYIPLLVSLFF